MHKDFIWAAGKHLTRHQIFRAIKDRMAWIIVISRPPTMLRISLTIWTQQRMETRSLTTPRTSVQPCSKSMTDLKTRRTNSRLQFWLEIRVWCDKILWVPKKSQSREIRLISERKVSWDPGWEVCAGIGRVRVESQWLTLEKKQTCNKVWKEMALVFQAAIWSRCQISKQFSLFLLWQIMLVGRSKTT